MLKETSRETGKCSPVTRSSTARRLTQTFPPKSGRNWSTHRRNSFNVWSTYRLPSGFHFGGGARFVDRRFGNTINTRFVDAYWTFDAMASYPISKHIDLKLNLYNLTDSFISIASAAVTSCLGQDARRC